MKWELWKDQEGNVEYIIAHKFADSLRKRLSGKYKVVWSCEACSAYDAQFQYLKYQGAWFRLLLCRIEKMLKPKVDDPTYKEMGWE